MCKKLHLKNAATVDTAEFAEKTDFADLKSYVDKLGIDQLKKCTKWFKLFEK